MARSRIGVTTETSVQSSPTNQSVPSGRFQVAGVTVKGPVNYSGIIRSIGEFTTIFGGRAPFETLYDTVRTFFQEGGAELIVTRAVGPNATNGSVTLTDGGTTPVPVLTVEVVDPGAHSAGYQAVVSNNTDATFNLSVVDTESGRVIAAFQKAESPADLASLAMGNENVVITALGAATNPAAGAFNLTAGDDDRAGVTAASYKASLDNHKGVRAGVAVAIPGYPASVIAPTLGEHCAETGKIGFLEVEAGATIDEAKGVGAGLLSTAYGAYLSMPLYPAIRVPDGNDRTRTTSPVGYVAAHRSFIHRTQSFAAAVAGPRVKTLWNFQPTIRLSEDDINELNESGINGIQTTAGAPYLNNYSSLAAEPGLYDLNVQDALNNLTVLIENGMSELIWRPNEGRDALRSAAQSIVDGIMEPLVAGGYLFPTEDAEGNYADNGYVVDVSDVRNDGTPAPYDRVQVNVGIKLSPTLRHIHVPIRKVDLRSTL